MSGGVLSTHDRCAAELTVVVTDSSVSMREKTDFEESAQEEARARPRVAILATVCLTPATETGRVRRNDGRESSA